MKTSQKRAQLRILAVTNLWPVGDSFRGIFVKEQVEALRQRGVQVDVEIVAQARGVKDYLLALGRVRRRAMSGDYDLVHIHYGMAALAARFVGVPRVLSLYGSDVNMWWQRIITKIGWGGVKARIYVSLNLAVSANDAKGEIIPDGVDLALFAPADRDEARASLGIGNDELVALFAGHPSNTVKGYDIFSAVLARLQQQGLQVRELILAAPNQPRTAVPAKFAAADVLLFTSRQGSEGSPSVIKEAAVVGLPVVTVAVGDVADALAGVTPSAVVEFPQPWGSDQTRDRLISDLAEKTAHVLAQDTRSNGREKGARFESGKVADQIIAVYHAVLAGSSADQTNQRDARDASVV